MPAACPSCACVDAAGERSHVLLTFLIADGLDRAMTEGLCDAVPCRSCAEGCNARLVTARDERLAALAARERHRRRNARVARLREARERERANSRPAASTASGPPALPASAADVLARALAKASGRR